MTLPIFVKISGLYRESRVLNEPNQYVAAERTNTRSRVLWDWLKRQKPQALFLWAVAGICFGLGAAGIPLLGIDPEMLIILAAVFAALTAEYSRRTNNTP